MSGQIVPVTFRNRDGFRLFGMLHEPAPGPRADTAILLLSPGVKMRVAPHRLYNKMAAKFASLGYPVFRFDFHGLGDAEGEAPEALLADLYAATQVGRYVNDTIAAMDWLQENRGISSFVAGGLCGGALTGLLAAQRDSRIASLLALSIPVILDSSNVDFSKYMTDRQLVGTRKRYLGKLRLWDADAWKSWARFFTFQSHYSLIVRAMLRPIVAKFRRKAPAPAPAHPSVATTDPPVADNTNPYFAPALLRMLSMSRPVLLLFAETDRLLWEFEDKFMARHAGAVAAHADACRVHVTPGANHIFSIAEWQQDAFAESCRWLERVAAPPVARAGAAR